MIAEKKHRIGRSSHVRYDFLSGGWGVFLQVDIYFLFSDVGNTLTTIVDIMHAIKTIRFTSNVSSHSPVKFWGSHW